MVQAEAALSLLPQEAVHPASRGSRVGLPEPFGPTSLTTPRAGKQVVTAAEHDIVLDRDIDLVQVDEIGHIVRRGRGVARRRERGRG